MNCLQCGKETKNPKFCSRSCGATYNNPLYHTQKFCEVCGKPRKENKRFCSMECKESVIGGIVAFNEGRLKSNRPAKSFLIKIHGHKCMDCGNSEWKEVPIPLVLDHIDGNPYNFFPENLRLLCPNCDALTPTYKGKNKGNGRHKRMERYYEGKSY
jgi:predicted nucleic acid-binding Zn ribbon protein